MAEESSEIQSKQELVQVPESNDQEIISSSTSDVRDISVKMERAREAYRTYSRLEHKPTRQELWACQIVKEPTEPFRVWSKSAKGLTCKIGEMELYDRLTRRSISIVNSKVSPLEWTSISWAIGLILASPALRFISTILDHGRNQQVITGAATAIGSIFCLPVGFFRVAWIFPLYIEFFSATTATNSACLKANAVKMHLLGLILSLVTSGTGFQFRKDNWQRHHILIFAALQSTSTGVLHAFGPVLLMDCAPAGTEGTFAIWFSWVKMVGTCLGFAVASGAAAGNVGTSFGIAFCTAAIDMLISTYGNISDVGGAAAAGLIIEDGKTVSSPTTNGLDNSNNISKGDDNAKIEAVGKEAA
ncbi:hypothetical protein CRYUN_Cryun19dG0163100 [Craigia yunnanensis]